METFEGIEYNNIKYFFGKDHQFNYPFTLIKFDEFQESFIDLYEEIIVDCGVMKWLRTEDREYPFLEDFQEKVTNYGNDKTRFVIPDYPTDIIRDKHEREKWTETFLNRTKRNIERFKDLPYTILSIQYRFEDLSSFKEKWDNFYSIAREIIGVGNLGYSKNERFFKELLKYIRKNNPMRKAVHFFGLKAKFFKILIKTNWAFKITCDGAKYSYADKKLKKEIRKLTGQKYYMCCKGLNVKFFKSYYNKLKNYIRVYKGNSKIDKWV